jgi:hypothetical protein
VQSGTEWIKDLLVFYPCNFPISYNCNYCLFLPGSCRKTRRMTHMELKVTLILRNFPSLVFFHGRARFSILYLERIQSGSTKEFQIELAWSCFVASNFPFKAERSGSRSYCLVAASSSSNEVGTTKMPSILSLSSVKPKTVPVQLSVQATQLQAFADINKLYPYGITLPAAHYQGAPLTAPCWSHLTFSRGRRQWLPILRYYALKLENRVTDSNLTPTVVKAAGAIP